MAEQSEETFPQAFTLNLLRTMDRGLHELSQPMTALLCLLEYGSGLEASDELKQVMRWSSDEVERLRVAMTEMQTMLRQEFGREMGQEQRRSDELTTGIPGRKRSDNEQDSDCGEYGCGASGEAAVDFDGAAMAGPRG